MLIYYAGHGDYEAEFEGEKEGSWILHDGEAAIAIQGTAPTSHPPIGQNQAKQMLLTTGLMVFWRAAAVLRTSSTQPHYQNGYERL